MTQTRANYRQILEASLRGDFDEAERLNAELGDIPFSESAVLVGAAFYVAVKHQFREDSNHAAVIAFVNEAMAEYANAQPPMNSVTAEALVRAALGESELMRGIEAEEAVPTQLSLVYKVVQDAQLSGDDISALLDQSERLATRWSQ